MKIMALILGYLYLGISYYLHQKNVYLTHVKLDICAYG